MGRHSDRIFEALHVLTLFGLAVGRPLLEILANNAQFFIVRRSPPEDLYSVVIAISLLIPGVLIISRHALDLFSRRLGATFHSFVMWMLFALLVMFVFKQSSQPAVAGTATAVILASLALYLYRRYPAVRMSISYLSPAILIVPLLFVFNGSISKILSADSPLIPRVEVNSKTPVTVLVLDELPLGSLLSAQMQIDEVCFPNFKRLQQGSTWYRNASAVSDLTEKGVAAVVTGIYPETRRLPTNFDYPENLFTLLAASYELNVSETDTKFHPARTIYHRGTHDTFAQRMKPLFLDLSAIYLQIALPTEYAKAFPPLGHTWRNFWQLDSGKPVSREEKKKRSNLFLDFVLSVHGPSRPVLNFLHVELPHGPWRYFPSGTEYNFSRWSTPLAWEENLQGWGGEESIARRAFQRYMLQMAYTDRLLGQLLDRLEAQELYDPSILIVTADHGICFHPKERNRPITNTNFVDTLSVPLFVKLPFQKQGVIDDRNAETVDVLPTIADALRINPGWKWDGESLLGPPKRKTKRAFSWMHRSGTRFEFPSFSYADSKALIMKLALFGSQVSIKDLFRYGPLPEVHGKQLDQLATESADQITVELYNRKLFENVDLTQRFVPAMISGKLQDPDVFTNPSTILLALNGIVRGSAQTFHIDRRTAGFALLVPESSFRPGRNEVTVILVDETRYLQLRTGWID